MFVVSPFIILENEGIYSPLFVDAVAVDLQLIAPPEILIIPEEILLGSLDSRALPT